MIRRLHPPLFAKSPLSTYSVLFVAQGYSRFELFEVFQQAWGRICDIEPLTCLKPDWRNGWTSAMNAYYASDSALDLGMTTSGSRLSIPPAGFERLTAYLSRSRVRDDETDIDAARIWPTYDSAGIRRNLVAVVKKAASPAELYQITPAPGYPLPIVAAVQAGDHWEKVIVRAIAQLLGGLADEYELPGDDFAAVPEGALAASPNVILINHEQRNRLTQGEAPHEVIDFPAPWKVNTERPFTFHPHDGADPNPVRQAEGGTRLVEGGAGYRFNALRADFDCLLRRQPYSPERPIQAEIGFCDVCRHALGETIQGTYRFSLRTARHPLLNSQRLAYDTVSWWSGNRQEVDLHLQTFPLELSGADGSKPKWSCVIDVNRRTGLTITDLKLSDRPLDPFAAAADVIKRIEFRDLSAHFEGDPEPTALPVEQAFDNRLAPPALEIGSDGGPEGAYQIGVKLTLSWDIPGRWSVEAAMSLLLDGHPDNDIDPGGAVMACKLFPQMAMRYRRPPREAGTWEGRLPRVRALKGTIFLVTNNTVPSSLAGSSSGHLAHMANDQLTISVFADSNSSDGDSIYLFEQLLPHIPHTFALTPETVLGTVFFGRGHWLSGRKLGGVESDVGGGFRLLRITTKFPVPGIAHWSWLFDYARPLLTEPKRFVAVYRKGEATPAGNDGGKPRTTTFDWPEPGDQMSGPKAYRMTVRKVGRQGAYDNVHVHGDMGHDSQHRPLVAAPFCADLCLHIHWRWGEIAQTTANHPANFRGWGNGWIGGGANSTPTAPLIPPNQHLELEIRKQRPGASEEAHITYEVSASFPRLDAPQVFFEHGIGFAFTYGGLPAPAIPALAAGLGLLGDNVLIIENFLRKVADLETQLLAAKAVDEMQYDALVRTLFSRIYEKIRWFNPPIDDTRADVQQIPVSATAGGALAAPAALEDL